MWTELKEEVDHILVVDSIRALEHNSERHLGDAKNDCHLHFETVHVGQLLSGHEPGGVHSYWVNTVGFHMGCWLTLNEVVAAVTEKIEWDRRVIVVTESTESGEDTHQQQEVSQRVHSTCNTATTGLAVINAIKSESENEGAVHDVTEHDREKEWEGNTSKHCRISFFISGNAVSIYDLLENPTEFCFSKISWAGQLVVNFTTNNRTVETFALNLEYVIQKL